MSKNKLFQPVYCHIGNSVIVDEGSGNDKTVKNLVAVKLNNLEIKMFFN